jgi:prevent-host-death family protein
MTIDAPEPLISAKDFQRHVGRYQRLAHAHPITITAHGEPSLVIMSIKEYQRLKRRDREVYSVDTMTKEQAEELISALDESLRELKPDEFDHELEGWKP